MKTGSVTLIYGSEIEKMVGWLLEKTGALESLRPDDRVMIKPNLVVSRPEWVGVDTDPRVIEALVKSLKERGIHKITIGDGSGMGYSSAKAFDICGYREMAQRYGLHLVDLERDQFVSKEVPIQGPFETLEIAQTVLDSDFLINVPVMKAHNETLVTCSLKNLKGVMPRSMKSAFHGVNLHQAIAQLNGLLKPHLILVDGIQGDLYSETGRTPVAMERIILGKNAVEVDSFVADTLGYSPRTIRHIAYSADADLGTCDLERIKIESLNRPSVRKRFDPPPRYPSRFPCHINADGACCTCLGNLIFALERLQEQGLLSERLRFLVGQKSRIPAGDKSLTVAVGRCAHEHNATQVSIDACPPTARAIQACVETEAGVKPED